MSQTMEERKPIILVVDDNPANLEVMANVLDAQHFEVITARNGENGLEKARLVHPELILLDVMLPEMSGFEVCQQLKSDPETQEIPIIFMTVLAEIEDKLKGFHIGAVDYITKPFQREEVLARVKTHLENRKLHRQVEEERERFQMLSNATYEGLFIHEKGWIIETNRTARDMFAYSAEALLGKQLLDLFPRSIREQVEEWIENEEEQLYEAKGVKRDQTIFPVEIQTRPFHWQGRSVRMTAVRDITRRKTLEQENYALRVTLDERDRFGRLVGKSPKMHKVYDRIIQAAASDASIIIYGETGTGKELAARMLFDLSEHHTRNFVAVNCGAIPENLFEAQFFGYRKGAFTGADRDYPGFLGQAQGGTLFLDEVGELKLSMQAMLLRVLNDQQYTPVGATTLCTADVRIIAATNRNLRELRKQGKIREDFFQRLHVITIDLPPLRKHKEDIPLLLAYFLEQYTPSGTEAPPIPVTLVEKLYAYDWPGNVRELFNELQRYLTTGEIELSGTPPEESIDIQEMPFLRQGLSLSEAIDEFERFHIERVLQHHDGRKMKAAEELGVSRVTLYSKLKKLGIS